MLYNIHCWWFFLSQGNRWTKYLVYPKIQRPKPCLLMFTSLVALNGFHLLLSTQLTANLTLEWSGGSMFHPLSHIYAKTPFCCIETVANDALNRQCIVVFDWLWTNKFVEFFGVFQDNCWVFSITCVCTTAFKVSISPLNCCFWQSRVRITLIKPLLC